MTRLFFILMVLGFYNLHGAVDALCISPVTSSFGSTVELSSLSDIEYVQQPVDKIEQQFKVLRQQYYMCCNSKVKFNIAMMLVSSGLRNLLGQHKDDLAQKPSLHHQIQELHKAVQDYLTPLINREDK